MELILELFIVSFFFAFAVFSSQINTKRPIHHMYTIRLVLFCVFVLRLLIFHMHTHSGCYSLSFLRWWLRLRGVVESQWKIRARKTVCRELKGEDCRGVLERCDGDGFWVAVVLAPLSADSCGHNPEGRGRPGRQRRLGHGERRPQLGRGRRRQLGRHRRPGP